MDTKATAERILHRWKVDLKNKDRTKASIYGNFDELLSEWDNIDLPLENAEIMFKSAIREHYPTRGCSRAIFKRSKSSHKDTDEDEFYKNWCKMIEDEAYQVFFVYYPIETEKKKPEPNYGGMSKQEHMRQIAYADSHPSVNVQKILAEREALLKSSKESE